MQIQMEVCDLFECDFIETRFKEFACEDDFYGQEEHKNKIRGVMLYFLPRITISNIDMQTPNEELNAHYVYMPLDYVLDKESVDLWINKNIELRNEEYVLYMRIYWYLEEFSCVLVRRNKFWFDSAIIEIEKAWNTILRERVEGYEHRAPKKKKIGAIGFGGAGGMSPLLLGAVEQMNQMDQLFQGEFIVVKHENEETDNLDGNNYITNE